MIREQLTEIDPGSLRLILAMVAVLAATAVSLYMVKPQYLDFRDRRVSYQMLHNQIDDQTQLQQAIDQERENIRELQLQLHGEAGRRHHQ